MIRHILRLETDAGRNLSRLKNIVAIEVENGFVLGEAVAQGNIHIARRRQVVDALNGFTMHKSGHRQLQVGLVERVKVLSSGQCHSIAFYRKEYPRNHHPFRDATSR